MQQHGSTYFAQSPPIPLPPPPTLGLGSVGQNKPFSKHAYIIPRRSQRDIVLASSMPASVHPFRPSVLTFCLSGTKSQYLLVRFDSLLVQMISTMESRYPISLVETDPLSLELLGNY